MKETTLGQSSTDKSPRPIAWRRNLYVLWAAQLIAMIGTNAYIPFLPLYVRLLGVTDLVEAQYWGGLIYAGPFFFSIFTIPLWGTLGDKYGRKLMIVRAIVGLTIAALLMGFAQNIWQLFLLRLFQGAVSGFIAASLSLVSSTAPEEKNAYAMSFLQSSVYAGGVIGPLVGGFVADTLGIRPVFYVVAILCTLSAVTTIVFVHDVDKIDTDREQFRVLDNLRFVWQNQEMRRLLVFMVILQTGVNATTPIMAYFLESLHTPPSLLATITGIMIALVGVLTTVFTPLWGHRNDRKPYQKTLAVACFFVGVATALQAIVPRYEWLFPLRIIIGIFLGAIIPTIYAALSKRSPQERRGGVVGLATSATLLGSLVSPLLAGWTAAMFGMKWCFVISGLLFIGVCPTLWVEYKRKTSGNFRRLTITEKS